MYTGRFVSSILKCTLNWYLDEAAYIQDNRTKAAGGKTICLPKGCEQAGGVFQFTDMARVPENRAQMSHFK